HGAAVATAGHHLPSSFNVEPQNLAEKINTDYKTWEFQIYTFGLGPALPHKILPKCYWLNYCKLVHSFPLLCQYSISSKEVHNAYILLATWEWEFEGLYYQAHEDCLHFVHPCVHQVLHLAPKTIQTGPPVCYAQWTMECTIGNVKYNIWQHKNYQANFAQQGIQHRRINALLAVLPDLDETQKTLPCGAADLEDSYTLL
ncbi:hypothetical protein BS17DRAFT_666846, partial [Gyrodon lividus]